MRSAQRSGRVRFKGVQDRFRVVHRSYYSVNVVSSCIDRSQNVKTVLADLTDRVLDHLPLFRVKSNRRMFKLFRVGRLKSWVSSDLRCAINVILAIHGPSIIAMQPGSVGPQGNEIRKRKFVIVKVAHGSWKLMPSYDTPSLTVGLLPRILIMNHSETVTSHIALRGSARPSGRASASSTWMFN